MSEGFFSRWSRRKQEAMPPGGPVARPEAAVASPAARETPAPLQAPAELAEAQPTAAAPLPTLDDVQGLTPEADFQPFMQRGVGAEVRNAAMKKLFADPHFNVMDGLDIYIEDYGRSDPLPAGMLRQMVSAQFLQAAPDETPPRAPLAAQDPEVCADPGQGAQVVAQSPDASAKAEPPRHDHHPDLQLQPDPDPADPPAGSSPR